MSRAAKKIRRQRTHARRVRAARAARRAPMPRITHLGNGVYDVMMPMPGSDHAFDENCPICRRLAGLPPKPAPVDVGFTSTALASARERIEAWQPRPGDDARLESARASYDDRIHLAGPLQDLLPGWQEHLIRLLDWPHTIAAELASTARAEGDHAAAEVLDALNDGAVPFDAIMTSHTLH